MLTAIFLIVTILLIVYQKHREGRWLNLISLLMAPYVVIVFFNNYFIYKLGFYKVSDDVILMLLMAFVAFFLGTLIFNPKMPSYSESKSKEILQRYDIRKIRIFLYIVGLLGLLEAIYYYRSGVIFNDNVDSEGVMGNGPMGHLLLSSYSVLPIYFLNWTYSKKKVDLIPILLIILVAFSSLIKYNVLGPIITLFIFISIYKQTLLKKAGIVLVLCVFLLFVCNYALGFAIAGSDVDPVFYLGHFWAYFAGSTIYDNYIFTSGIRVDVDIFYKLMTFFFALPNMFLLKLYDKTFFVHKGQGMQPISDFAESSNIVDVIGYLYPSKGDVFDIVLFLIVIFLTGVLFSFIYKSILRNNSCFNTFIANFLTYFVFLCFYAPFFVLPAPWEICVWAIFLPFFFLKRTPKTIK